ncbi:hypothetical protein I204_07796 [Kwoniella mangroviensis CBS 8886]|uniref:hypothetical protein n=1 Tax=Kwoniella mangroviensis CBS 8507 TaxID=1296122 RepID=UPI00080CD7D2|nr:uncharacterized protein I203_05219 [Kwoniella mangroviensis CBS 8507]OCF65544.1 hypothetical protein I203_05219 [Kwoniella mangroviensis CBS 8507]OCF71733.1 hypothetical protein I204_07796 [Kwoniella mangroviensis CBS 8886]
MSKPRVDLAQFEPAMAVEETQPARIVEQLHLDEEGRNGMTSSLPRVDGGWGAWSYLATATALETLVWGMANSYGVYLDHYTILYPTSTGLLPIIGTVAMGIMYLLMSPLSLYLTTYPLQRKITMWIGLVVMFSGFIGAAFASSAAGLVVTQGVLYGIGGTLLYCPTTNYMFEWWLNKRGLASGIMLSGTGAGGLVMPLISNALLQKYGKRTTLLSIGISYTILIALLIPFIKPRLPIPSSSSSSSRRPRPKVNWGFMRRSAFWLLWAGVLFQGLAAFMPVTYLPSYATALSLSPTIGTLTIALMNLARVPGQVIIGHLADKMSPRKLILLMAIASGISVFAGWGAAKNVGGLVGFSLAFGAFAGSYTALFSRFIAILNRDDPHLPAILYSLFFLARGIGSIASGPLSSALMSHNSSLDGAKGAYGVGEFGVLIIWTGTGMIMSGVGAGYKSYKVD